MTSQTRQLLYDGLFEVRKQADPLSDTFNAFLEYAEDLQDEDSRHWAAVNGLTIKFKEALS